MIYSRVKLPTKSIYQKWKWSSPQNGCGLLKYERGDLHTLNTMLSSSLENCQNPSIKACEGMKHAIMRNEGVHKNVLTPFPITRFLRLTSIAICDIWVLAFL